MTADADMITRLNAWLAAKTYSDCEEILIDTREILALLKGTL